MGLTERKASDLSDGIINLVRQIKQPGVLFFEAAPHLISARTNRFFFHSTLHSISVLSVLRTIHINGRHRPQMVLPHIYQ